MPFSTGQLVELKSGGPVMTIGSINDGDGTAVCFWFDDATLRKETIPFIALEPSEIDFVVVEEDSEEA